MFFGTQKTTVISSDGATSDVVKYHNGIPSRKLRSFRVKVKVISAQDEMTEFIRFTDDLAKLRQKNRLTVDPEDPTSYPAFLLQYPKHDVDGSYFVIKSWTEVV